MGEQEVRTNLKYIGYLLKTNKSFRDWTRNRCQQIRATSHSQKEIYVCNKIIKYINDLDFRDIMSQNKK